MEENPKTKKTKSGQSRDEVYRSTWAHWDRMQFLVPQLKREEPQIRLHFNLKIVISASREMNDDNEVEVASKAKCKSFAKNERKEDPIT